MNLQPVKSSKFTTYSIPYFSLALSYVINLRLKIKKRSTPRAVDQSDSRFKSGKDLK